MTRGEKLKLQWAITIREHVLWFIEFTFGQTMHSCKKKRRVTYKRKGKREYNKKIEGESTCRDKQTHVRLKGFKMRDR